MKILSCASLALGLLAASACRAARTEDAGPAPVVPAGASRAAGIEGLGHVDFPNTGPAAAQEPFLRGVLLLHSFEYPDAAEAFREAQAAAPDFGLASWGEALTFNHPIWQEENLAAARAVLERMGKDPAERAAKGGDARERALIGTLEVLYGEGTREERADAYCAALEELHARYPEDLEIASFHALAILGTATQGRDIPTYMRAAAVAEAVLERAPDHPGALHYAIHAFDDPIHAPLGLRMARRYGVVAAAAEHALHMPSHIYVALGLWSDSIEANLDSSAAADARRARKHLGVDARGYHSLSWLAYSYLQTGAEGEARRLLEDMRRDAAESGSKRARAHLVAMRAAYVVALDAWQGEWADLEVPLDELEPAQACAELYVRGRVALARGDLARARDALAAMAPHRGPLETMPAPGATAAQCCSLESRAVYLPGRLAAQVMELELSGCIALAAGAEEDGIARLHTAAEKEDEMGFDFGPPTVVEPAHELLGRALLERGRGTEAAEEFAQALKRAPNRTRSLSGFQAAFTVE